MQVVVASNDLRKRPNYERLASSPVLKIGDCDVDICACDGNDNNDGERANHDDAQLFAVGAEVMLTYKWVRSRSVCKRILALNCFILSLYDPPSCHERGSCRFHYICIPDDLTYVDDAESGSREHFSPARNGRGSITTPNRSCSDGGPTSTCNRSSIATPRSSTLANARANPRPTGTASPWTTFVPSMSQDLPAENAVRRLFAGMTADTSPHKRSSTLLLGNHLVDAQHLLRNHKQQGR